MKTLIIKETKEWVTIEPDIPEGYCTSFVPQVLSGYTTVEDIIKIYPLLEKPLKDGVIELRDVRVELL